MPSGRHIMIVYREVYQGLSVVSSSRRYISRHFPSSKIASVMQARHGIKTYNLRHI